MLKALGIGIGIAYPFLVYSGLSLLEPRSLALLLGGAVLLRVVWLARSRPGVGLSRLLAAPAAVASVLVLAAVSNDGRVFLWVPVLVNLVLLASFAHTLRSGPSMIETFARLQVDDLSERERAYAGRMTRVWCGFFVLNGGIAAWLAVGGSLAAWTFYTGFLSYVLMGCLFAVEFLYRTWRYRRYVGGPLNPVLERIFPPLDEPGQGEEDVPLS